MKKIKVVAIITARKGSKRIKNKNLKKFFGKPVIFYSIKSLKKAKIFDEIIVSTNCKEISKVSLKYGVDRVLKRPNFLSTNKVGSIRVINHSIKSLKKLDITPKFICCIYPAAPLTRFKNITYAYERAKKVSKGFVYPSTFMGKNESLKNFFQKGFVKLKNINVKEGIVKGLLLDAGQFWFARTSTWKTSKTVYTKNSLTFTINEPFSDINSMKDWKRVEKIFKENKKLYLS